MDLHVEHGYEDMPVCSYNEWDPLEEIIVGRAEGQRIPELEPDIKAKIGKHSWEWVRQNAGQPHDPVQVQRAAEEVEEFVKVLQMEGVKVRRPEIIDWAKLGTMKTPFFEAGGYMNACPRDGLLVIGDEIIEAPMAWRSRVWEFYPYRKMLNEYFHKGAKWTAAPRPMMRDELFKEDFPWEDEEKRAELVARGQFILTEAEVCFDAADVLKFGKDILICLTHATNRSGVEWLRRHLEPRGYNVHSVVFKGLCNCHADATFMPLRPGLVFVCPVRPFLLVNDEPMGWEWFTDRGWDVVQVPEPQVVKNMLWVSQWVAMNVLSIDQERVVMQKGEKGLKKLFESWGLKPIEVDMINAFHLGGAFHCWTLDIKRRGKLQSYF